jgi:hypothetical protein
MVDALGAALLTKNVAAGRNHKLNAGIRPCRPQTVSRR